MNKVTRIFLDRAGQINTTPTSVVHRHRWQCTLLVYLLFYCLVWRSTVFASLRRRQATLVHILIPPVVTYNLHTLGCIMCQQFSIRSSVK